MEQTASGKKEVKENETDNSSRDVFSLSCSKCGKPLSLEDSWCTVDPDKKVLNWRFSESIFLLFYCANCIETKRRKP